MHPFSFKYLIIYIGALFEFANKVIAFLYSLCCTISVMAFSYKKLWKLLIDKDLRKSDLERLTGLSRSTISKLSHGENVNTEVLERICVALNCDLQDIIEIEVKNKDE